MKIEIYDQIARELGYKTVTDAVIKNKHLLSREKQKLAEEFLGK